MKPIDDLKLTWERLDLKLKARRLAYSRNPIFAAQVDAEDEAIEKAERRLDHEDEAIHEAAMEAQYRREESRRFY